MSVVGGGVGGWVGGWDVPEGGKGVHEGATDGLLFGGVCAESFVEGGVVGVPLGGEGGPACFGGVEGVEDAVLLTVEEEAFFLPAFGVGT